MLDALAPYAKAVVAFLAPGILVLCVPLLAGRMPSSADNGSAPVALKALGSHSQPRLPWLEEALQEGFSPRVRRV